MSMDMNRVVLVGRLGATPELKSTGSGISVASYSVAVGRYAGGKTVTDWIDCVSWRNDAEFLAQYGQKGQEIAVSGHLEKHSYENRNGQKIYTTELVTDNVGLGSLPGKSNKRTSANNQSNNPARDASTDKKATQKPQGTDPFKSTGNSIDISSEDLPF